MAGQQERIDRRVGQILKQYGYPDNPEPPTEWSEYIDFKIVVTFPEPADIEKVEEITNYLTENLPDADPRIEYVGLGEDKTREEAFEGRDEGDGFMTDKMYLAGSATMDKSYSESDLERVFERMVTWTEGIEEVDAEMDYWR